jgi:transcriptional regulator with XRE-family HTH domain
MTPDQIKHWRKELGWTQAEAAANLGISRVMYSLYERGRRFEDDRPVEIPKAVALACLYYSRRCLTTEALNFVNAWKECGRLPETSTDIVRLDSIAGRIESILAA